MDKKQSVKQAEILPGCLFSVHIEGDTARLNINMHDAVESE